MIDIANLPSTPTAADFGLKIGNDSNPDAWADAPTPTSITVREGAGANGSDRVTILFADGAIVRQWLQVTVLANANTGLESNDVFYFGNDAPLGGDATGDSSVGLDDFTLLKANFGQSGQTFATGDFTGDGTVGLDDFTLLKANFGQSVTPLTMITTPATAAESMQAVVVTESMRFGVLTPTADPFSPMTVSQDQSTSAERSVFPTVVVPLSTLAEMDSIVADDPLWWNYQTLDSSDTDAEESPFENLLELPLV